MQKFVKDKDILIVNEQPWYRSNVLCNFPSSPVSSGMCLLSAQNIFKKKNLIMSGLNIWVKIT